MSYEVKHMSNASQKGGKSSGELQEAVRPKIRMRVEAMWALEDDALDFENIEGVHQMRVASRKLRAALDSSRDLFPEKRYRRVHKKVRRLTRALGRVRDPDVMLAELQSLREASTAGEHPGIDRLVNRQIAERDVARARLVSLLDDLNAGNFQEESLDAFAAPSKPDNKAKMRRRDASRMIEDHVTEFLDHTRTFPTEQEADQLHEVRIATKRLRYALQLFEKPLKPESTAIIEQLTELQDELGEIHNLDVLIELTRNELVAIADEAVEHAMKHDPGPDLNAEAEWKDLIALLTQTAERRRSQYEEVRAHWEGLEASGFTGQLVALSDPDAA
jgi:CHAD domain-containing protein